MQQFLRCRIDEAWSMTFARTGYVQGPDRFCDEPLVKAVRGYWRLQVGPKPRFSMMLSAIAGEQRSSTQLSQSEEQRSIGMQDVELGANAELVGSCLL